MEPNLLYRKIVDTRDHLPPSETETTDVTEGFALGPGHPVLLLNRRLNLLDVPCSVNESIIRKYVATLERTADAHRPEYWLMTARLTEMTLICAGHYADNCEFTAAGDLLINPHGVNIYLRGNPLPIVKQRHGRLSDQFRPEGMSRKTFIAWFQRQATIEIDQPALLPYLLMRMEQSGHVAPDYLATVYERMQKVSDTIGFLSAWSIKGVEDLYWRLRAGSPEDQRMAAAHLCRFDRNIFRQLDTDIRRLARWPELKRRFPSPGPNTEADASATGWGMRSSMGD